ncbi:hypothetical protein EBU95_14730, partial [bacterium]|nr:hypothetical protein [bacterium]
RKKSSEKSLIFSKKIVAMLEEKMQMHNDNNVRKVKLIDLKRAYKSGFTNNANLNNLNSETIATVNMYLRIVSGSGTNIFNNFKSKNFEILGKEIVVNGTLSPDSSDYDQAEKDIVKYKLEDFDFKSEEELYLEDEEDRVASFDIE